MTDLPPLMAFGLVLTSLSLVGYLARRTRQSLVPFYIGAGIVLGPSVPTGAFGVEFAVFDHVGFIEVLAEVGVIALLFFLGMHVDIESLVEQNTAVFKLGAVDLLLNAGMGVALSWYFGFGPVETLFFAGVVYMSSSAVVSKSLFESGWASNPESEPMLGLMLFQDVVMALYLAVLSAVAFAGGPREALTDVTLGLAVVALVGGILWKRPEVLPRLLDAEGDEMFLLRLLGGVTLVGGISSLLGVSGEVVAFLVGAGIGRTALEERVDRVVKPTRDLFAAVFFFSIGLMTNLTAVYAVAGMLLVAVAATIPTKFLAGYLGGRSFSLDRRRSTRVGFAVLPSGEFSLVIATMAISVGTGALASTIPQLTIAYVLVMATLGTVLIRTEGWLYDRAGRLLPGDRLAEPTGD